MTKCTQLIIGLLIFISCSSKKDEKITWLESDWIYVRDTSKFFVDPSYIGLRFHNDTLTSMSDFWMTDEGRYSIKDNVINVNKQRDTTQFKIIKITPDTLILFGYKDTLKYYNRKLEFDPNLMYQAITLQGGTCFGNCSEFIMTLDEKGNVEFEGLRNSKVIGKRKYLIKQNSKERIDSLFKWTNLTKLDTTVYYGSDDDWDLIITFEYLKGEKRKIKGTLGSMPFRLHGIIWILVDDLRKRELIKEGS